MLIKANLHNISNYAQRDEAGEQAFLAKEAAEMKQAMQEVRQDNFERSEYGFAFSTSSDKNREQREAAEERERHSEPRLIQKADLHLPTGSKKRSEDLYEAALEARLDKSEARDKVMGHFKYNFEYITQEASPREVQKLTEKAEHEHNRTDTRLTAHGVADSVISTMSKEANISRTSMDNVTIRSQSPESLKQFDDREKAKTVPAQAQPVIGKLSMMDRLREKAQNGIDAMKDKLDSISGR